MPKIESPECRPRAENMAAVAQNLPAVQHQEGQPPLPQEVGHDLAEGLLLAGGGGPVQEDPGHPLPGGAGGGEGLEHLSSGMLRSSSSLNRDTGSMGVFSTVQSMWAGQPGRPAGGRTPGNAPGETGSAR